MSALLLLSFSLKVHMQEIMKITEMNHQPEKHSRKLDFVKFSNLVLSDFIENITVTANCFT